MATAEFSEFADILSAALSQHHLSGFEIAQLEFHHLTSFVCVMLPKALLTSASRGHCVSGLGSPSSDVSATAVPCPPVQSDPRVLSSYKGTCDPTGRGHPDNLDVNFGIQSGAQSGRVSECRGVP